MDREMVGALAFVTTYVLVLIALLATQPGM